MAQGLTHLNASGEAHIVDIGDKAVTRRHAVAQARISGKAETIAIILGGGLKKGDALAVARANAHVRYPARIQLVAAMNPCKCGLAGTPGHTCRRGAACASDYQARVSGP